jgi:hypothetical protein
MLVLKRKEGQWVEVIHHSGDTLRVRVYGICGGVPGRVNLAFDDGPRNFEIRRPERRGSATDVETPSEVASPCAIEPASAVVDLPVADVAMA